MPTDLAVSPALLRAAQTTTMQLVDTLETVAADYWGPRRLPLGDAACAAALGLATRQLVTLLGSAAGAGRELADGLRAAALVYVETDRDAVPTGRR